MTRFVRYCASHMQQLNRPHDHFHGNSKQVSTDMPWGWVTTMLTATHYDGQYSIIETL